MALRKIHLHGILADLYGPIFEMDVATAGEAIRALGVCVDGFLETLKEGAYEIVRGETIDDFHLELDHLNEFKLGRADLHIVPVIAGSKRSGLIKSILGVALIGAAIFLSGGTLAAPLSGSLLAGGFASNLALAGLALTFAGVSSLLTPKESEQKSDASFNLSGPLNATGQGNPVPVVYGRCMVGSTLISAGLDIEPINISYQPYNPGYYDR